MLLLICLDCLVFSAAGLLTVYVLRSGPESTAHFWPISDPLPPRDVAIPLAAILAYLATTGRYTTRIPFSYEMPVVVSAGIFASLIETAYGMWAGDMSARIAVIAAILLALLAALICNRTTKLVLSRLGVGVMRAIVVNHSNEADEVGAALSAQKSLGYQIVACIDPSALETSAEQPLLQPLLKRYQAQCLLIVGESGARQRLITERALQEQVPFATVAKLGFRCGMTQLYGQDIVLISHLNGLVRPAFRGLKAAFDLVAACLILVLLSPLLLAIALAVAADGGPVLFAHSRLGMGGRHFRCLKFRTMVTNADQALQHVLATDPVRAAEWRDSQKLRDDPRVTRIGRILRSTSLDELPQLLNVLRLDMSLVGPRPIVDNEVAFYGPHIAEYFAVRPGLTGLWQVSGRSDTTYAQRVRLDAWYVNNWTIWCDITVLLRTIPVVIGRQGAR